MYRNDGFLLTAVFSPLGKPHPGIFSVIHGMSICQLDIGQRWAFQASLSHLKGEHVVFREQLQNVLIRSNEERKLGHQRQSSIVDIDADCWLKPRVLLAQTRHITMPGREIV